jgi:hypothetical protein
MTASPQSRKLTLADIADVRAYERERTDFRARVIELKRRRRVCLGAIVTVLFENRDTIRFQIQEMSRVENLATDAAIQDELDTYNPMIPEAGQLRATLFIELTTDDQMREWLPKLVGVQHHVVFHLPGGQEIRAVTDQRHESQLTRDHVTSAVHYLRFDLSSDQVAAFDGAVVLAVDHPDYDESSELSAVTVAELRSDLDA